MTLLRKQHPEHGWGLLPTLVIILILTLFGTTVLFATGSEMRGATRQPKGDRALNIAEAGIAFAFDALQRPPYNFNGPNPNFNKALSGPLISDSDPDIALRGWREPEGLEGQHAFGGGWFRVALRDGTGVWGAADNNTIILLRALGADASGVQRLIEVSVVQR